MMVSCELSLLPILAWWFFWGYIKNVQPDVGKRKMVQQQLSSNAEPSAMAASATWSFGLRLSQVTDQALWKGPSSPCFSKLENRKPHGFSVRFLEDTSWTFHLSSPPLDYCLHIQGSGHPTNLFRRKPCPKIHNEKYITKKMVKPFCSTLVF